MSRWMMSLIHPTIAIGLAGLVLTAAALVWRWWDWTQRRRPADGYERVRYDATSAGESTLALMRLADWIRQERPRCEVWLELVDRVEGPRPPADRSRWLGTALLERMFPTPFGPPPVLVLRARRTWPDAPQGYDPVRVLIHEWTYHGAPYALRGESIPGDHRLPADAVDAEHAATTYVYGGAL